jgi:hypothetical protein
MEVNIISDRILSNGQLFVQPGNSKDIAYWSKKMGVSQRQLRDAILETGSLYVPTLRAYLTRDSWLYHPLDQSLILLRSVFNYLF